MRGFVVLGLMLATALAVPLLKISNPESGAILDEISKMSECKILQKEAILLNGEARFFIIDYVQYADSVAQPNLIDNYLAYATALTQKAGAIEGGCQLQLLIPPVISAPPSGGENGVSPSPDQQPPQDAPPQF